MNFTREPIIETIITPKEGCKLLIRNSKGQEYEAYHVDSIEVVTFGHSLFFRSLERPKSFLLPVTDYEVVEVKEARLALKSAPIERSSIKIGGGRLAPRPAKEGEERKEEAAEPRSDKKKDRRRSKRRREEKKEGEEEVSSEVEVKRLSRLLPPPPTLIAQTINKYKEAIHPEIAEEEHPPHPEPEEEPHLPEKEPEEAKKKEEGDSSSFWGLFS